MSLTKTNLILDKILKGVVLNKNNEVDYTADIVIELEKDIPFEYAIVENDYEEKNFIPFSTAKKFAYIKHKNTDGIFRKSILLLKTADKSDATVNVTLERILSAPHEALSETLGGTGPRGTVLLAQQDAGTTTTSDPKKRETTEVPWYQNPWILGAILVGVLIIVMMRNSNSGSNGVFI